MIKDEADLLQKIEAARKAGIPEDLIMARVQQELKITAPQTIQQPERQRLLRQIASSVVDPFAQTARMIGGGAFELGRLGRAAISSPEEDIRIWEAENPFLSKEKLEEASKDPRKFLLEQIKASAGVAAWAVPGGGALPAKLAKGALAGGLAGFGQTKGTSAEELAKGFGKGALIGGVTAGALDIGGRGVKAALSKIEERAAKKLLGGTGSQFAKALRDKGIDPIAIAKKYGLLQRDPQKALDILDDTIKSSEDDILREIQNLDVGVGKRLISKQTFIDAINKRANALNKTNNFVEANGLQRFAENFGKQHGKYISADQALAFVRDANRNLGARQVTTETLAAQAEGQRTLAKLARKTLKGISTKIKDSLRTQEELFTIEPILRSTMGKVAKGGTLTGPGGLTGTLAGLGVGGVSGGPAGLATYAGIGALRGRTAAELATKGVAAGTRAAGTQIPQAMGQIAQRGLPPLAGMAGGEREVQGVQGLPDIDRVVPQQRAEEPILSSGGQWRWDPQANDWVPHQQEGRATRLTEDQIAQMAIQAAQSGDPKEALAVVSALAELAGPAKEPKQPTAAVQKVRIQAKSGLRGLDEVRSIYEKDPNILAKQTIPGQFASRKFDSALFKAVEAILRVRSGAAVPETEVRRYMNAFGPRFGDAPDVVKFKIDGLEQDLLDMLGIQETLPDITQVISPY